MLKILYILPYDWGGMPHYTAELANAVSKYEEVTVIGSQAINTGYYRKNVKVIKLFDPIIFSTNYVKTLINVKNIVGLLSYYKVNKANEINPDIIHLTTPLLPPLPLFIRLCGLDKKYKIVFTKHTIISGKRLRTKIFELIDALFELSINYKKWIVHTDYDKKDLNKKLHVKEDKIVVIPHGAYSFFKLYSKNAPVEKNSLLFFGRITDYKGMEYLLDAIPLLAKDIPDIKITIAGDGDLSSYSSKINRIDKKNLVIMNEYLEDEIVSDLFERAELVILPYNNMTGQSGVLNIACAYNKPVIVSDVGGLCSWIENGKNGIIIPPKDAVAIADSVKKLLNDEATKNVMINSMVIKAEELSWDNIAKKHIALYTQVLSDNSK